MVPASHAAGYAIGPAFVVLAAWFVFGPNLLDIPHTDPVRVSREEFTSEPLRRAPTHPPAIRRGGYDMSCMECHRLIPPPREPRAQLTQHTHIEFDHGKNDRCYNCHDRFDRDRLVLPGGGTIAFTDAPLLCATCHGPTYRDWEVGIHGRTAGSWDGSRPEHGRLTCTQCHDPHAPAFGPMTLLPGPNTIRMSPKRSDHYYDYEYKAGKNPLWRWKVHNKAYEEAGSAKAESRAGTGAEPQPEDRN